VFLSEISSQREQLKNCRAIYLIQPTQRNLTLIEEDFRCDLYENVYLIFVLKAEAAILERLARIIAMFEAEDKVKLVWEEDLSIISLGQTFYTIN